MVSLSNHSCGVRNIIELVNEFARQIASGRPGNR